MPLQKTLRVLVVRSPEREVVAEKLHGDGDWLNLRRFHARLDELSVTLDAEGEVTKLGYMQQLREYGLALSERYPDTVGAAQ